MQLSSALLRSLAAGAAAAFAAPTARADDRVDMTTTWYQERRRGPLGGLSIVHPQLDLGVDIGDSTSLDAGYSADVVSGATAAVYSVDAVSSATEFSDTRHEGSLGLGLEGRRSALNLSAAAGVERDYASLSFTVAGNIDLPGKNTNLALSYTHSFDEVCDKDNAMATPFERRPLTGVDSCEKDILFGVDNVGTTVWRDLSIDTAQATLTQNLSPTLIGQATAFGQVLHGFQENPYRRVRVRGVEPQESVPDVRGRLALLLRVNKYLEGLKAAVHGSARGYSDTWGVNALTLGMGWSQYFADSLLLRVRGRIYQQTEAVFFKDAFFYDTEGAAGEYFTGDRELGAIRNIVSGAKLSYISFDEEGGEVWGVFDQVQLNLKADLFLFDELPADPIEDNRAGIDRQFLSSGQFLDAFVLQLGLLMRY